MEGFTSCLSDMLDSVKAAQAKLDSSPFSMGDFLKKVGVTSNQPTVVMGRKQYKCDLCGRCFSDPSNLRRHKNIHTGLRPYECDVCGSSFRQKSQLDRHHLVHTGERPFRCAFCSKGFRDSTELRVHFRVHTGERPYSCSVCQKSFSRICYMKRHQEKHTKAESLVVQKTENSHIMTHASENEEIPEEFQCSFCSNWFETKKELEAHRPVHLKFGPTGQKLYECVECKKCFNNSSNLRKHTIIHTGKKPFTCNICNQRFRQATHLQRHYLIHTGERPFKCSICQKGFRDTSDLLKHQRVHTGEKPYQCSICDKSFKHLHNARVHRQRHLNEGYTPEEIPSLSPCPQPESSPKAESYDEERKPGRSHNKLSSKHKEHCCSDDEIIAIKISEDSLKCNVCDKTFTRISSLHRHYLMHTGYRPFSCHVCSKTFQQLSHLDRHKRIHTGERRYHCTTCRKGFRESSDLLRHQQVHMKDKSLGCQQFDKTYPTRHYLKSHQMVHEDFLETEVLADVDDSDSIEVVVI
ncbi:uncharacterized protein LOC142100987 [Mixophyes fleayi]|uniref:uncharacterized protein LOC142100987 n=1 Tax=Mixophyes fleayi TaxID=3061075 RepID=UPI003F4DA224